MLFCKSLSYTNSLIDKLWTEFEHLKLFGLRTCLLKSLKLKLTSFKDIGCTTSSIINCSCKFDLNIYEILILRKNSRTHFWIDWCTIVKYPN